MELNVYIIKFAAMAEALKNKGLLTDGERVRRFAEGLPRAERRRLMEFCLTKGWSLTMDTEDAVAPAFEAIKSFVFCRALLDQEMSTFDSEVSVLGANGGSNDSETATMENAKPITEQPSQPSSSTSARDPIADLAKQFEALALKIERGGGMMAGQGAHRPQWSTPNKANPPSLSPTDAYVNRRRGWPCPWYDGDDHGKQDCAGLPEAI